jgi:hypothetical protein
MRDPAVDKLACPRCGCELEVSALLRERVEASLRDSIGREIEDAAQKKLAQKDRELDVAKRRVAEAARREADLLERARSLDEREQEMKLDAERKIAAELARIRAHEADAARERAARESAAKIREVELAAEQRVAETAAKVREEHQLRDEEHREQIESMQRTIRELQRKAEQTTQQLHGEAQEVALRDLLHEAFPHDDIDDVAIGTKGADLIQHVRAADGQMCETIIWESKRTRNWSNAWLAKLRDDQRDTRATVAVLVTQVMPGGVRHFGLVEGVWVCHWPYAAAFARVLRDNLVELARARRAAEGRGDKMHKLYDYLTGPEFKARVTGLLEAITDMRDDLERERAQTKTRWSKREKQIERALDNVAAFHGDLQGIGGGRLIDLPLLELDDEAERSVDEVQGSLLP